MRRRRSFVQAAVHLTEWLFEDGIGERRAALVVDGQIVRARIERDGKGARAGAIVAARIIDRAERLARLTSGEEVYLIKPPAAGNGDACRLHILREAMLEPNGRKRATAEAVASDRQLTSGLDLRSQLAATGISCRLISAHEPDVLAQHGWGNVIDEAATGLIPFEGGLLRLTLTPAMAVFDVDGTSSSLSLALNGATATAAAIRRHGIGGNVIVDLPTLSGRDQRLAVATAFDQAMGATDDAYERTAINGFGLLQIVLPRRQASLPELIQLAAVETSALALLRQAERQRGAGSLAVTAHPSVIGWLGERKNLVQELGRRTGRPVTLHQDPACAIGAGHAQ